MSNEINVEITNCGRCGIEFPLLDNGEWTTVNVMIESFDIESEDNLLSSNNFFDRDEYICRTCADQLNELLIATGIQIV